METRIAEKITATKHMKTCGEGDPMDWPRLFHRWMKDYDSKTFMNSTASLVLTSIFAMYNGFLGIRHQSVWHGSVCVYYLLLILLRSLIILTEKSAQARERPQAELQRRRTYRICSFLLLLLNLAMIGPIVVLVRLQRPVNMTMIPAIAMAAYAFYKIVLAAIHLGKRKRSENCLVRLLRSINFIDALLSIMALQNTLIMVVTKGDKLSLLPLTATTSGLMWAGIVALSVSSLVYGVRK